MSCRLFNVGNTHVLTAGLSSDGTLSDYRVFDTPGFDPEPLLEEENAVVSVVPAWEEFFLRRGAFVLNRESCRKSLSLQKMETPETVGADRIANSIALISSGKVPALSIDCGTAITFEYVDSENFLRGGAILPGVKMSAKALSVFLSLLMIFSICAPAAMAAVDEHEHAEKPNLNYVSLGDSMSNGFGLDGYAQDKYFDVFGDNEDGVGYYGEGAYTLLFEEYLKGAYNVNHSKLAVSAMLSRDLLFLVGGGK